MEEPPLPLDKNLQNQPSKPSKRNQNAVHYHDVVDDFVVDDVDAAAAVVVAAGKAKC